MSCSFTVIVLCDSERYRNIMVTACELGMCTGEYLFIYPAMMVDENFDQSKPWMFGDENDEYAHHAFKYMLYVS